MQIASTGFFTRKSKIKNLARLRSMRNKLTLSIVSILSCLTLLFVGGVASTINPMVDIDNPISYTSDIAFEKTANEDSLEFYIRTYEDLQTLANLVNTDAYIFGTNIKYSEVTYILLEDISNPTGKLMAPIGTSDCQFTGKFYGNNHTITNLVVNHTTGDNAGLFGVVSGAEIKDLIVASGTI